MIGTPLFWLGLMEKVSQEFDFTGSHPAPLVSVHFLCAWHQHTLMCQHTLRHFPCWVSLQDCGPRDTPEVSGKKLDMVLLLSALLRARHIHSFLTSLTYPHQYFSRTLTVSRVCQAWLYCLKQEPRKSLYPLWPPYLAAPWCYFLLVNIWCMQRLVLGSGPSQQLCCWGPKLGTVW